MHIFLRSREGLASLMSLKPMNSESNSERCLTNFFQRHPRVIGGVTDNDNGIYPKNRRKRNYEPLFSFLISNITWGSIIFFICHEGYHALQAIISLQLDLIKWEEWRFSVKFILHGPNQIPFRINFLLPLTNCHKPQWLETTQIYYFLVLWVGILGMG